jgi:hypothetical protein
MVNGVDSGCSVPDDCGAISERILGRGGLPWCPWKGDNKYLIEELACLEENVRGLAY